MKIVLTGSLGNIGMPLTKILVAQGHEVTLISSSMKRKEEIGTLGAQAAIGSMFDADFLAKTFLGADVVYLMETLEAVGSMFDPAVDFYAGIDAIGKSYTTAIAQSGVTKVVHLSSVGAHTSEGNGILKFHHMMESHLRSLAPAVTFKFIRPVGFYTNMFSYLPTIKTRGAIISNYGGDQKEPWVSPSDIAEAVAEAITSPFTALTVRYVASDECSPNALTECLATAIGMPGLKRIVLTDEQLLDSWLSIGFNPQIAKGFVEMQAGQRDGSLYQDFNEHKPQFGRVKLADFAKTFAEAIHND